MPLSPKFIFIFVFLSGIVACKKNNDKPADGPPETEPPTLLRITMNVHEKIGGFYLGQPARYDESGKTYPLIVFIHGGGQYGQGDGDLPRLLTEGIPRLLKEKRFPASVESGGKQYSFVVAAPQFKNFPDNDAVGAMISYMKSAYRIDTSRIYLTGFSIGARVACDYAAAQPKSISAFIAMSGVSSYDINGKSQLIGQAGLPGWGFHNRADQVFPWENTKALIMGINEFDVLKQSRLTIFEDSTGIQQHDSWSKATDPNYKENGKNIYQWMLQFTRK